MTERVLPVMMKVLDRGVVRSVRVGQAVVSEGEVVLSLEPMHVGAVVETATPQAGSRLSDLEWLAQRSRRILDDPKKTRWHADMRVQLARIEEEMERLRLRA